MPALRKIKLQLLLVASLASACGEKEDPDLDTNVPPVTTPDSGGGATPTTSTDSGAAPSGGNDAGSTPPVTRMDAGSTPPSTAADTGAPAVVDAGPAADAGAGSSDGGGTGTAPTLPSPDELGPYEVVKLDNVGMGFENPPTSANDRGDGAGCTSFIQSFGESADAARDYALFGTDYKVELYTVYYPKSVSDTQTFPILSWANGTCAKTVGYEAMLKHIASHGFIVVATNSRYTGSGAFQRKGIDFMVSENGKMGSPLFKHVDVSKVGVFGHSQGGGSTGNASADMRVKSSVLMHGGSGGMLHAPGLFLTGDGDLNPSGVRSAYNSAPGPTAFGSLKMSDHITMMKEPKRMAPEVLAWFRYTLLNDEVAKKWYVGADCLLCKDAEWVYAQKNLQ